MARVDAAPGWPPPADEPGLVTIETGALIRRPIDAVFAFATNASLWPTWHPATAGVAANSRRPLVTGESVTESIRAGGLRFDATWTVLACEAPHLWVIATATPLGAARIVYELRADGVLTRFFRTLSYRSLRWPWTVLDSSLTRWVLTRQSERALDNLKLVLERTAPA
jgi:uncharacterized protein YndB with AHSA1/START domain